MIIMGCCGRSECSWGRSIRNETAKSESKSNMNGSVRSGSGSFKGETSLSESDRRRSRSIRGETTRSESGSVRNGSIRSGSGSFRGETSLSSSIRSESGSVNGEIARSETGSIRSGRPRSVHSWSGSVRKETPRDEGYWGGSGSVIVEEDVIPVPEESSIPEDGINPKEIFITDSAPSATGGNEW